MNLKTLVLALFFQCATLSDQDRETLRTRRCLKDAIIEKYFRSGTPEGVYAALEAVKAKFAERDIAELTGLLVPTITGAGYTINPALIKGSVLIAYLDEHGTAFLVRPHKDYLAGSQPEIFGTDSITDGSKPVIIVEGELKAACLHGLGLQALSVPGVTSFVGDHYPRLVMRLQAVGARSIVISYDNADCLSPTLPDGRDNPHHHVDPKDRFNPEHFAYLLGRRLEADGFCVRHAPLPDEWRVDGEADVDSVLYASRATEDELRQRLLSPITAEAFLNTLPQEARERIAERFGDGQLRRIAKGAYLYRQFPIDLRIDKLEVRKNGIPASVAVELNLRAVHTDRVGLERDNDRRRFARRVREKLDGRADADELGLRVGAMIEQALDRICDLHQRERRARLAQSEGGAEDDTPRWHSILVLGKDMRYGVGGIEPEKRDEGQDDGEDKAPPRMSNFYFEVVEDVTVDDGLTTKRIFRLRVMKGMDPPREIEVPADEYHSRSLTSYFGAAGSDLAFFGGGLDIIRGVAAEISTPQKLTINRKFGWQTDGAFVSPSIVIEPTGAIVENKARPLGLEHEEFARHLDLQHIADDAVFRPLAGEMLDDFLHIHESIVGSTLLGQAGLAPLRSRVPEFAPLNRAAVIVHGVTGRGKGVICTAAQSLFGAFGGEGRCASWSSTPNFIQKQGYWFADAIYFVDDLKRQTLGDNWDAAMRVLQTYADGRGRSRLRRDSSSMPTYYNRGALVISAEDLPTGEASVAGRCIHLPITRQGDLTRGDHMMASQNRYPAIMARYIGYLTQVDPKDLWARFLEYRGGFLRGVDTNAQVNAIRIASGLAQNLLGFATLLDFLDQAEVIDRATRDRLTAEHREGLMALREQSVAAVHTQKASVLFTARLGELIRTGEVRVDGYFTPAMAEEVRHRPLVGHVSDEHPDYVLIMGERAYEEVQRRYPSAVINHSLGAIRRQLKEDGLTLCDRDRTEKQAWRRGRQDRYLTIKRSVLGLRRQDHVNLETAVTQLNEARRHAARRKADAAIVQSIDAALASVETLRSVTAGVEEAYGRDAAGQLADRVTDLLDDEQLEATGEGAAVAAAWRDAVQAVKRALSGEAHSRGLEVGCDFNH
jgi:hypothetical protein